MIGRDQGEDGSLDAVGYGATNGINEMGRLALDAHGKCLGAALPAMDITLPAS